MSQIQFYLLFDRVQIQAANAISGPLSYGFPSLNGFLGAIHALNRKLPDLDEVTLGGVLVACHDCAIQTYRTHSFADATFNQSRNPLKKTGETASIIEEGKVHLTVSLLIEVTTSRALWNSLRQPEQAEQWCTRIQTLLMKQRIAGGSITDIGHTQLFEPHRKDEMIAALLPAFVLMDAGQDLIAITRELQTGQQHLVDAFDQIQLARDENGEPLPCAQAAQAQATALDALIEVATLHHLPPDDQNTEWRTHSVKSGRGWLVPLPIGYQGIAPPFAAGELTHCRTVDYPSQYVETIYSLGKWIFPFRLPENFQQCFWRYAPPQDNLYLITQTSTD